MANGAHRSSIMVDNGDQPVAANVCLDDDLFKDLS